MLTETLKVPRTVAAYREPISQFTLHAFGDDSTKGVCGAVYVVVQQAQGTTQQLISAKSRLVKENQSTPRLELIAGHMAVNLATNVQAALHLIPIAGWTRQLLSIESKDKRSIASLSQIECARFSNMVTSFGLISYLKTTQQIWEVEGEVNAVKNAVWKVGPAWLSDPPKWPPEILLELSPDIIAKAKVKREILSSAIPRRGVLDPLMDRYPLTKALRIQELVGWFIHNCQAQPRNQQSCPITTDEVQTQELWWIKQVQQSAQQQPCFQTDKLQLNLQLDDQQVLECRGRIMGEYPVYLPDYHVFTQKLVFQAYFAILQGSTTGH